MAEPPCESSRPRTLCFRSKPVWTERLLLRMVKALYQHRVKDIVAHAPAEMTAEVLAASDKMTGMVGEFTQN